MISVNNICKSFGDKVLFEDFSFTAEPKEFVVITGKSGCGKTTLLNILGGLEAPDSGSVSVDGNDIQSRKFRRVFYADIVGFLFQNFALVENKTVRQNLEMVMKKHRSGVSAEEALKMVGIEDKKDSKVFTLSGGEQQRVALARLIFKRCDLILADEPTGSLDSENEDEVLRILHSFCDLGKTVITVTHSTKIISMEKRVIRL